jgi:hypothetical protein
MNQSITHVATPTYFPLPFVYSGTGELWNTIGPWLITGWIILLLSVLGVLALMGQLDCRRSPTVRDIPPGDAA